MKKLFFIFVLLLLSCTKPQRCWDCEIKVTTDWYMTAEHDTLIYSDTIETWCDIDPRYFEKINTDTTIIFYLDTAGNLGRLYGFEFKITKCH
jgi:hypothetical protein